MLTKSQVNNLEKLALAFCAKQAAYVAKKKKPDASKRPALLSKGKTEQVKRLVGCVKAHFSEGHWKGMAHILSALLGVPLSSFDTLSKKCTRDVTAGICPDLLTRSGDEYIFRKGVPVVPIKNPNSHNYALGRVCFISKPDDKYAYRLSSDDEGNHLPSFSDGETCPLRVATAEEVKAALAYYRKKKRPAEEDAADIGF